MWQVLAASLAGLIAFGGASAASAAPPYETEATITSIDVVSEEVESGTDAQLTGTWSLPDNPTTPAGFTIDLPPELQGLADAFSLLDDGGEAMGSCVVTATQIVCDFDDAYLLSHPRNLSGSFDFWANIRTKVTEDTETTYTIGGQDVTVIVTPSTDVCVGDCIFTGRGSDKSGTYDRATDTIMWVVRIASGPDGAAGGESMVVEDNLGPNQELLTAFNGKTYPMLRYTDELVITAGNLQQPGNWVEVPLDQYDVDGGTVSWTAEAGYYYSIRYVSKTTDGGAAGTYTNEATVTTDGNDGHVRSEVVRQGGGGSGTGDRVGKFSITKDVIWEDASVEGLSFSGTFTVTSPTGVESSGEFVVAEGATWTSAEYTAGSVVHIDEILPTEPGNLIWEAPVLSVNDFPLVGATTTEVSLTNEATLARGVFNAKKSLRGNAAESVPADTVFHLDYSYAAGPGFSAGNGTLELPADGTLVTSQELPVGAVLSLSERAPQGVVGATWTSSKLSTSTVTIGASRDESVTVTVTNVLEENPVETPPTPHIPPAPAEPTPPTPSAPSTSPTPSTALATTGGEEFAGLILLAGTLAALGLAILRRSRTARTYEKASIR